MRRVPLALCAVVLALVGGVAVVAFAAPTTTPPAASPDAPVVCDSFTVESSFGAVSKTALESHRIEVEDWLSDRAREGYLVPLHDAVFPPSDGRTFAGVLCVGRSAPPG